MLLYKRRILCLTTLLQRFVCFVYYYTRGKYYTQESNHLVDII